ncbi:hypothetical protein Tco_0014064 [Tanacetum coccineum]
MKESVPRDLPPTPFLGHLKEQMGSPYRTRETVHMIGNPEEIHNAKAQGEEGDMDSIFSSSYLFHNPFSSTTIGDENPIRTLGDYSKPSHEGYRNTIELPIWNNMVPLRSDTIRLVQNRFSFHELRSEYPNQHLKDFLKLVALLDLDGVHPNNGEDLTTDFLLILFSTGEPGTVKLRNDILMFQQNHRESLSEAWTRFKDLLQKFPQHGIDLWLQLHDLNAEESWALLEDLALFDNESWNDPRDFAKSVKEIALPQDVPSTSDRHLIKLKNQVQRLMEAYLAPTQPTQVNKITTSCEICSGPHDTQYCMEDAEQAFVEYTSSCTDEAGDARLSKFEADFKQQQSEMTNKINTVLKPSIDSRAPTSGLRSEPPNIGTHPVLLLSAFQNNKPTMLISPSTSINAIKAHFNKAIISQTSMQQPVVEIKPQQPEELYQNQLLKMNLWFYILTYCSSKFLP